MLIILLCETKQNCAYLLLLILNDLDADYVEAAGFHCA